VVSSFQVFWLKFCVHFSSLPHILCVTPLSFPY
jgi:hypothetical protein